MEYLLIMALSGTTMTCMFFLLRLILKEKLCASVYCLLAKAALLYYLIPLPFVKSWYREIVPAATWEGRIVTNRIPLTWTNYLVHADGDFHVNFFAGVQAAVTLVWLVGAGFLIIKKMVEYLRTTRRFATYAKTAMTEQEKALVDRLRKEYGVKRSVSLLRARDGDPSMTFGILRPVIICAGKADSRETELLARHEMVHIKRFDVLWKIIAQFAIFLHWWNPFVWKLRKKLEHVCECACDDRVVQGRTKEETKMYLLLLIDEAEDEEPEEALVKWNAGFGGSSKHIRERMMNIMNHKKWNRLATGALAAALILANSITAFAYRDPFSEVLPEGATQEDIEKALDSDKFEFVPDMEDVESMEENMLKQDIVILYEDEFIDEEGNIYPVLEDDGISPHCNHVYVSGTERLHRSFSNGGCEVNEYKAQQCAKCGQVIRGDWIATHTWAVCPH